MAGVTANESYYVDNVGDVLNEDAAGATDTVFATVGFSLTAGQEVEVLRAYGAIGGLFLRGNDPHEQGGPDRVGPHDRLEPLAPSLLRPRLRGGRRRDPSRSDGKMRWVFPVLLLDHRHWCRHHLTYPLLRNGSLPLPRSRACEGAHAAERTLEVPEIQSPVAESVPEPYPRAVVASRCGGAGAAAGEAGNGKNSHSGDKR